MEDKRTYLYKEGEEPTIFDSEKAVKNAVADGWVDSPDKTTPAEVKKTSGKVKAGKEKAPDHPEDPESDKTFGDI